MELDSVARVVAAFYRLVGSESGDEALIAQGESADDVAYLFITRGCRNAQRWLLKMGFNGWRKRSAALTWVLRLLKAGGVVWTGAKVERVVMKGGRARGVGAARRSSSRR